MLIFFWLFFCDPYIYIYIGSNPGHHPDLLAPTEITRMYAYTYMYYVVAYLGTHVPGAT